METDFSTPTTLSGLPCHNCGHTLPRHEIEHLIGAWTPELIAKASEGVINELSCDLCRTQGHVNLPVACFFDRQKRTIVYIPDQFIILDLLKVVSSLLEAIEERVGPQARNCVQVTQQPSEIPKLLEVPHYLVPVTELFSEVHRARLLLRPEEKPKLLVRQLFELEDLILDNVRSSVEIILGITFTPYEQSPLGKWQLQQYLASLEPVTQFQENIIEFLLNEIESTDFQVGKSFPDEFEDSLHLFDSMRDYSGIIEPNKRLEFAQFTMSLTQSEFYRLAQDVCMGYLLEREFVEIDYMDLLIMSAYGSCLLRDRNPYAANTYFDYISNVLPTNPSDEQLIFLAAHSREMAGRCFCATDRLSEGLENYQEALGLYEQIDRPDAVKNMIIAILPIAAALGEISTVDRLQKRISEENLDEGQDELVLTRHRRLEETANTENIRKFVYRLTDWTNADLDADEIERRRMRRDIEIIPLNYEMVEGQPIPDDALSDMIIHTEYSKEFWQSLNTQAIQELPGEFIVAQHVVAQGKDLLLVDEIVVRHAVLQWVMEQPSNVDQIIARMSIRGAELLNWAVNERHYFWLRSVTKLLESHFEDELGLPPALSGVMGQALTLAVGDPKLAPTYHDYFLNTATALLQRVIAHSNQSTLGSEMLTPQGMFQARSSLSSLLERQNKWDDALDLISKNLNQSMSIRHASIDMQQRRAVRRMLGDDAVRINRIRLRRHSEHPPTRETRVEVFNTVEMTRNRLLGDLVGETELPDETDGVQNLGSTDSPDFISSARHDLSYHQLSLVLDHDDFKGHWVHMTGAPDGNPLYSATSYEEPYNIYLGVEKLFEVCAHESDPLPNALPDHLQRWTSWVEDLILFDTPRTISPIFVSCSDYLLAMPWSFAGACFSEPRPIITTFSGASIPHDKIEQKWHGSTVSVFVDPLGDLKQLHTLQSICAGVSSNAIVQFYANDQATAKRFRTGALTADLLLYVGHGEKNESVSKLLFHYGQSVFPSDFALNHKPQNNSGPRLAVILSCWGGQFDLSRSRIEGETDGFPYRMRALGYDFVIASLWPVSPEIAHRFVEVLIEELLTENIPTAFVNSYSRLHDTFGREKLATEGGCIQLIA